MRYKDFLIIPFILLPSFLFAQVSDFDITKGKNLGYDEELKSISEVSIAISVNSQSDNINKQLIADYVLHRFRYHFRDLKPSLSNELDSFNSTDDFIRLANSDENFGLLEVKVLVVNDKFPIAVYTSYHFNTRDTHEINSDETLGIYGNKEMALEEAKRSINSYIEYLAIYYQKLTGKI